MELVLLPRALVLAAARVLNLALTLSFVQPPLAFVDLLV